LASLKRRLKLEPLCLGILYRPQPQMLGFRTTKLKYAFNRIPLPQMLTRLEP
jgi:hypothetical protein